MVTSSAQKMSEWLDGNWSRIRGAPWKAYVNLWNTTECPRAPQAERLQKLSRSLPTLKSPRCSYINRFSGKDWKKKKGSELSFWSQRTLITLSLGKGQGLSANFRQVSKDIPCVQNFWREVWGTNELRGVTVQLERPLVPSLSLHLAECNRDAAID